MKAEELNVKDYMQIVGRRAREGSRLMAKASTHAKNAALAAIAAAVRRDADKMMAANIEDVEAARADGIDAALLDRLRLTDKAIEAMAEGPRAGRDVGRPDRRNQRFETPAQRHPGGPHARAAGCDRHHL